MRTDGTYIIAEAGVNHNGSLDMARRLIDAAASAHADAVKFQTFRAENLVTRAAPKAQYQQRTTGGAGSQFEMIKALELAPEDHRTLKAHAERAGLEFLSTPFDEESLALLTRELGLRTIKVSSGDLTNAPLLLAIGREAGEVILSTGMATLAEVEAALGVLAYGFLGGSPADASRGAFERAYASVEGQAALVDRATLLHCTTEYPAPMDEVNLQAMVTMAEAFGLRAGYSDHTKGAHVAIAAVALGATVIEKHFTLDRDLPGPDHKASLEPQELRDLVSVIRDVERALGDGIKRPTDSEWKNRDVARKSLVAARALKAGERLEVACKRPGTGVSPFEYWDMQRRTARRDYLPDEALDE
jgi:N-acetylneuraminate synthase